MSWLNRLAERRMQAARLKGQLQGLAGEGKPLPDRTGDAFITPGEAVGFRIMAEAGVLPEEIGLKKAAQAQREKLGRGGAGGHAGRRLCRGPGRCCPPPCPRIGRQLAGMEGHGADRGG